MQIYFVEFLSLFTFIARIWPHLRLRVHNQSISNFKLYYFDGADFVIKLAHNIAWGLGGTVEKVDFRMIDVRDEAGKLMRLRIAYEDLTHLQTLIVGLPAFRSFVAKRGVGECFNTYLAKNSVCGTAIFGRTSPMRSLYLIQVCAWKMRHQPCANVKATLFLDGFIWLHALTAYGNEFGIETIFTIHTILWNNRVLRLGVTQVKNMFGVIQSWLRGDFSVVRNYSDISPRVAIPMYGHFNLNRPDLHSDFFFWQQSELPGRSILALFNLPQDPLDAVAHIAMTNHGILGVATNHKATSLRARHVYAPINPMRTLKAISMMITSKLQTREAAWLLDQEFQFHTRVDEWKSLIDKFHIKVHTSWYRYDSDNCVVTEALRSNGGVATIYQRAYESHPSPETTITTDVFFGFTPTGARNERLSNSYIPYYVATGYLGDHRFPLLRERGCVLRAKLCDHGARRIICYFDENSASDSRWHTGHEFMRLSYAFLLEQLLRDPELGLIFKPKVPKTLRTRLGPVDKLLAEALATGRCFVYEGGALFGSTPPAEAAMAADLAIHGHLCAGTAGIESALSGIPTLLMDGEGWPVSPLYQLGVGRVVFTDWLTMWNTCQEHWKRPDGVPGLGDWTPIIAEIDPFRDGRAAERMGTYLHWLILGFEAGLSRETVLADAAERYCKLWGHENVVEIEPEKPYPTT